VTHHDIPRRYRATGYPTPEPPDNMRRGYARSRERTEAVRAQLEPLAPGERPLGITLAVALAVFLALANLVATIAGGDQSPAIGVVSVLVLAALAVGLWERRYVVILIFQALLAITIIISALSLAFAGNFLAVLLAVAVVGICSPIFWLLVRVMARLQVPRS
jgi:hypothetical protein